jgi:hypothetical protein
VGALCGLLLGGSACSSHAAAERVAPSGFHELTAPDPATPSIIVGQLTSPDRIADFFAPDAHDAFVDLLTSARAEEAVARAWVSAPRSVRAMEITFADGSGASTFLRGGDGAMPSATSDTELCRTPEGRDTGCAEYRDLDDDGVTQRAVLNWKQRNQVTLFVAESPSHAEVLELIDWAADAYGAP